MSISSCCSKNSYSSDYYFPRHSRRFQGCCFCLSETNSETAWHSSSESVSCLFGAGSSSWTYPEHFRCPECSWFCQRSLCYLIEAFGFWSFISEVWWSPERCWANGYRNDLAIYGLCQSQYQHSTYPAASSLKNLLSIQFTVSQLTYNPDVILWQRSTNLCCPLQDGAPVTPATMSCHNHYHYVYLALKLT